MSVSRTMIAFPRPPWIEQVSCDGKPCGANAGCTSTSTVNGTCESQACNGTTTCDLTELLERLARQWPDRVVVKIADYSSQTALESSLAELNRILAVNRVDLRVRLENLELVFSQVAPFITIDDTLAFLGKTPTETELVRALGLDQLPEGGCTRADTSCCPRQ